MEKVVNQQYLQQTYSGKKVFVTGHSGFKGAWMITWLNLLGAQIKGYALPPETRENLFDLLQTSVKFEHSFQDIRNREELNRQIVEFQPDFIFHLAAQPLVRRSYRIPAETFEVNAIGTANVLEACKSLNKKCTVIVITTDKVYENREMDVLYNENDILGGYDPYSASKACTELVVNAFRNSFFNLQQIANHEIALASVRAGNVIGGGDFSEDRIIPDIVRALQHKEVINVRNPKAIRPWQHVLEPLGGYLLLGAFLDKNPVKFSGAYNFGPNPPDHLSVKELVELSVQTWGTGEWKDTSDPNQPHEAGFLKLDISKAKEVLGWSPKLEARDAISWTIDWYKQPKDAAYSYTVNQINAYMNS